MGGSLKGATMGSVSGRAGLGAQPGGAQQAAGSQSRKRFDWRG